MNLFALILSIAVSAQLDSTELWVGDQTQLHLQATHATDEHVAFPVYGETLIDGIEIVSQGRKDTTWLKDGRTTITQNLTITSFSDSLFFIHPLPFVSDNGDTLYTEPLALNVIQPFEIDSAENAITDIKPVYKAPVWWWGIFRWVLLALAIAAAGTGFFFLVKQLRKRKQHPAAAEENPELLRPADEVALEKLDKIKEAKIWQQGRLKDYHTELTDVVREYISRRFEVSSQEKTSDEILREMKPLLAEQKELFGQLGDMLRLADLVKFAKWNALPDENETSLLNAYRFVRTTRPATDAADSGNTEPVQTDEAPLHNTPAQ